MYILASVVPSSTSSIIVCVVSSLITITWHQGLGSKKVAISNMNKWDCMYVHCSQMCEICCQNWDSEPQIVQIYFEQPFEYHDAWDNLNFNAENMFDTQKQVLSKLQAEGIELLIYQALDVFNGFHCLRTNKFQDCWQNLERHQFPVLKNVCVPPTTKFWPKVPPKKRVIAKKLDLRQKCVIKYRLF